MQEDKSYSLGKKDFSYNPGMDPVRELIVKRIDEMGETLASISRKMGKSHSYLQQFIKRGIPAQLKELERRCLAGILDLDEEDLGAPVGGRVGPALAAMPSASGPSLPQENARVSQIPLRLGATIPAYGHAAGGPDGQFILNGNKVDDILAPPSLLGVRDAYAVYVVGSSMEPRYHPGEVVFVNPRLPVRRDDYVVVQIAEEEGEPPEAYVKRFLAKEGRHIKLEQLHPKKVLRFPLNKVVSVHRIIMGGDG